jgi:hypothetical protein
MLVMWGEIIESPSFRLKKAGTGCVQIGVLLHQLDVKKEGSNAKERKIIFPEWSHEEG